MSKSAYSLKRSGDNYIVRNSLAGTSVTRPIEKEKAMQLCNEWNKLYAERVELLNSVEVGQYVGVRMLGQYDVMEAIGRGEYPYDCEAKTKRPNDMIFMSPDTHSWSTERGLSFIEWATDVFIVKQGENND